MKIAAYKLIGYLIFLPLFSCDQNGDHNGDKLLYSAAEGNVSD